MSINDYDPLLGDEMCKLQKWYDQISLQMFTCAEFMEWRPEEKAEDRILKNELKKWGLDSFKQHIFCPLCSKYCVTYPGFLVHFKAKHAKLK